MAQVLPLRPHTFRLDNCLIDDYAAEIGALGVAIYAVLQRYADRTTGQCWPSVATIARLLRLSKNCVKKYLHLLARLGLITIAPRATAEGDPTSNLYTVHDPTQREAVLGRRRQRGEAPAAGGGAPDALPPQANGHFVTQGRAPDGPEQVPAEQEHGTSAAAPKITAATGATPAPVAPAPLSSVAEAPTAAPACDHPEHEHWSPGPGLTLCLDCFQCWEVAVAGRPPALALMGGAGPQPATACRP
jgi:Helix-turn-helix domain